MSWSEKQKQNIFYLKQLECLFSFKRSQMTKTKLTKRSYVCSTLLVYSFLSKHLLNLVVEVQDASVMRGPKEVRLLNCA